MPKAHDVVLVHGGFVDGSGWEGVYGILRKEATTSAIVQNPTTSLADDVAVTKRAIAAQEGPVVLVGHSYGGVVITEAGNAPEGQGARLHRRLRTRHGRVGLVADQQPAAWRAGPADPAAAGRLPVPRPGRSSPPPSPPTSMPGRRPSWRIRRSPGASQRSPARSPSRPGKAKPSWYLVATDDKMIPPPAQRSMAGRAGSTVVETAGSHAVYVSQPAAVAALIQQAVRGVK